MLRRMLMLAFAVVSGLLFAWVYWFSPWAPARDAKELTFRDRVINVVVGDDGSLHVNDTRTVKFKGAFTWMEDDIDYDRGSQLADVTISEAGREYEQVKSGTEPGTFRVFAAETGGVVRYHFAATDEERTFTLAYTVTDAIFVHNDVAELYWKFVDQENEMAAESVVLRVQFPPGAGDVQVWGHGPLYGDIAVEPSGLVTWTTAPLPSGTMLEARAAFATASVPGATRLTGETALPGIVAEEEMWAKDSNRFRLLMRNDPIVAVVVLALVLVFIWPYWQRYGRHRRPDWSGPYFRELPASYSPAELGLLLHEQPQKTVWRALSATLLDLDRRGYIKLLPVPSTGRGKSDLLIQRGNKGTDSLQRHEQLLIDVLFRQVAQGGNDLRLSALKRWFRQGQNNVERFWRAWQGEMKGRQKALRFWLEATEKDAGKQRFTHGMLAAVFIVLVPFVWGLLPVTRYVLPVCVVLLLGVSFFSGRTQKGANDYARWQAFKRFLLHFSRLDLADVPDVALWDYYLVYATVLGVADKVLAQMKQVLPHLPDEEAVGDHISGRRVGLRTFDTTRLATLSLASGLGGTSFATMRAAAALSSSGSGSGGGFSSGGGGGSGGGRTRGG